MTDYESIKKDIDGFGKRTGKVEVEQGKHMVKIEFNEDQTAKQWLAIAGLQKALENLYLKVGVLVGIIQAAFFFLGKSEFFK